MNKVDILSGNKLIAEFMGGVFNSLFYLFPYEFGYKETWDEGGFVGGGKSYVWDNDELQYHSSWDWLMPVIEKISKIEFHREEQAISEDENETIVYTHYPLTFGMLNQKTGNPMFRYHCGGLFESEVLIEAAWMATVDFIKFNNKNQ